ncbi:MULTISPECIES: LysR family transcriptional regulator substrate-binding protein [unclassified Arthrobacter]|uniref:LysR family transcriptional regulator substrate-binding protein n=1 Tax=unclassified Arthrobacter TaxID=235627 RepID=UPI001E2C4D60|nr:MULTISPECIES: LysR family transcriptional regulator substrate-binding protein [unclassified Arthrobacter]MCC9144241.1 LysR family transcriptional regulator substrate-binding protein [Arthrobacter sp. zg-Y919]MDK1275466.1 LysR family transcriptional regulator substrate-binding protein [Arthrobacter sp. zg.Y919]MDM7991098.1 LysR family transcriptional regulator substrate-binding protein [Arthrobacter sp. zg-Y877]WIB03154.1 LysR family transcriptional regulator substrate-binding protein [Arthro
MPTDTSAPLQGATSRPLTVAYVPGVTPGKWITRWRERQDQELRTFQCEEPDALEELASGRADLAFVRIPAEGFNRPDGVNLIPLYEEQPVAAAAKEHPLAAFDEVELADLDGETILDIDEMGGAAVALEVAAAGSGVVILPMSVARLHSRKDVAARPVNGVPATRIGIAWRQERDAADIEEFIGVVRGRTANSSRQPSIQAEQKSSAKKRTKERQTRSGAKPAVKSGGRPGSKGKGNSKGGKPRRSR